jgi:hypothetical protein
MVRAPVTFVFWVVAAAAHAEVPEGYRQAAAEYGLPPKVVFAIALTESGTRLQSGRLGPWPWMLNIAGKPRFYATRREAFRTLEKHLKQGVTNIDVGLMQVNWRYHRALLRNPWVALDPAFNLRVVFQMWT